MIKYTPEQLDSIFKQVKELIGDAPNKLRAIDLRLFIDQLYPREEEISKQNLAEMNQRFVGLNERVRHIEECLGIDFNLDSEDAVEYVFIQDINLREKANAYYREMLRYKYATRNHKQCFGEFCRLAIIQVELMLNYFFCDDNFFEVIKDDLINIATNKFDTAFNKWKTNCKGRMPQKEDYVNEILHNKEESISQLNYSKKSDRFCSKYLFDIYYRNNSITSISIWTSNMRNRKSHGSWSSITPYEEDYLTEEDKQNIEKWEKELLEKVQQYNKTNEEKISFEDKHIKANKKVWKSIPDIRELYNKYSQLQWVSEKPYDDVHQFLRIIASTCAKELGKKE